LDGFILSGGGDIDPSLYGGLSHPEIYGVDLERDQSEIALVKQAADSGLPLFGICRGIQVMNVALGGTLMAHLPDRVGAAVLHRHPEKKEVCHAVRLATDSFLIQKIGTEQLEIVSYHHQAIDRLAASLKGVGHAPDGIVEAVEMPNHPFFIGVQWHPELSESPLQQKLFDAFVSAARAKQGS
jgi:putative glutamine amidotransferase